MDCDFETASIMPSPPLRAGAPASGAVDTKANGTGTGANANASASASPTVGNNNNSNSNSGSNDEGPYVYEAHQTNPNGLMDGRKGCRMC